MIEKFKPLLDRILIKRDAQEEKTDSGIILSEVTQDKKQTGKVIAVGLGKMLPDGTIRKLMVERDDVVYFSKFAGIEIDEDHILLREEEILGIIK